MPADVKARYYNWYKTEDADQRTEAYEWWPEEDFVSSMSFGSLHLMLRESPDDVWGPPMLVARIPWVVAQGVARRRGFNVEVANA